MIRRKSCELPAWMSQVLRKGKTWSNKTPANYQASEVMRNVMEKPGQTQVLLTTSMGVASAAKRKRKTWPNASPANYQRGFRM